MGRPHHQPHQGGRAVTHGLTLEQTIGVAIAVFGALTAAGVAIFAVTWKLSKRAGRQERDRKAAEARKASEAASERRRASLKQSVP